MGGHSGRCLYHMDLRALNIPATYSSRSALNTGGENSIVLLEAYRQKRKEYECRKRPSETACTRAPRDQRDPSCTVSNVDTATTKTRHWHGHAADCNQACESTIPRRLRHARNTPTSPPETLDRTTSHCAVTIFASSPVSCCWMSCNKSEDWSCWILGVSNFHQSRILHK